MRDEIYSRALRWNELLSKTVYLFLQNIKAIFAVMVIIFLPISLLESIITDRVTSLTQTLQQILPRLDAMPLSSGVGNYAEVMEISQQVLLHEGLYVAVLLFLQPVGIIAVAKLIKARIDGESPSVKTAIQDALNLEPVIIVSGFLYGVCIFLGSLVIIPGIYFSIAWGLYLYCIGLGGRRGWDALRHSKELVRGKWWRTLGYLYLLSALSVLGATFFQSVFILGEDKLLVDILYHFLCYFTVAFVRIGETLLFINREAMAGGQPEDAQPMEDRMAQIEEKKED